MRAKPIGMWTVALVLVGMTLTLVTTGGAASAGSSSRRATEKYTSPAPAVMPFFPYGAAVCSQGGVAGGNRGCATFGVLPQERFVNVRIVDASGLPVPGFIAQSDRPSEWIPFCGATARPIRIKSGVEMVVWAFAYQPPNLPACTGTATTGDITSTFFSARSRGG